MLISFDGLDSSGKATQVRLFVSRMKQRGRVVHTLETPDYNTPTGQELRQLLQGTQAKWQSKSWQEKMRLFAANRMEHKDEVIAALARDEVVVYDRYIPSSIAFLTVESGAQADSQRHHVRQVVEHLEYNKNGMPREKVSIFLDVPPRTALELLSRRKQVRKDPDEYTDQVSVQQKLYDEYQRLAAEQPQRFLVVSCQQNGTLLKPEQIAEQIEEALVQRFKL